MQQSTKTSFLIKDLLGDVLIKRDGKCLLILCSLHNKRKFINARLILKLVTIRLTALMFLLFSLITRATYIKAVYKSIAFILNGPWSARTRKKISKILLMAILLAVGVFLDRNNLFMYFNLLLTKHK